MSKPNVFVTRRIPEAGLKLIQEFCQTEVWPDQLPPSPDVLREKIRGRDGIVTLLTDRLNEALLKENPSLKVISNFAVGVNNIDTATATDLGIPVGNTPDVLTDATADIAVALLLAVARRIVESATDAREGRWLTWEPLGWLGKDLVGRTLGIVGMGRIGMATARRLHHGWGMRVLYTARHTKPDADRELCAMRVDLDTLLKESDFVSIHADLNLSTTRMFNRERFEKMKRSAILINSGRGAHVDHAALVDALKSGRIAGAGLDVTDPEPLPKTHELYSLPNCLIVPHIASATPDTRNAMARICAGNLIAGLKGEQLPHCVNPEVYNRPAK